MAVRRLIINADDFGLTSGVNRAIADSHRRGIVTSSTLMANSQAFAEAARMAGENPNLSVGCHVVLVDGPPVSPPEKVPTLLLPNENTNQLRESLISFVTAAWRGRLREEEIAAEIAAQIRKVQAAGISVSHVDSHKHTHIFPAIFKPLLAVARECGVRAVRNPFGPIKTLAYAHLMRRPKLWTRYTEVGILRHYAEQFKKQVKAHGMITPDGSFGVVVTGALTQELFDAVIGCIPEGTWEFVCHPGYHDADLEKISTRLRSSRDVEMQILTSDASRATLQRHGIELISYREL
jgi:hopanoid biosynthesis associated protein HpnK